MASADLQVRIKEDSLGQYIIVQSGDTLSQIALDYFGSSYKDPDSYQSLGTLNKLHDVNFIKVGQKIYLSKKTQETVIPLPYKDGGTQYPTVTVFGVLANDDSNKLTAVWTWDETLRADTEAFDVEWREYKGVIRTAYKDEEVWVDRQISTYDIPSSGAITKIQFRVRPIPKVDKNGDAEKERFSSNLWTDWNDNTYHVVHKPDAPGNVSVTLEKLALTASIDNPTTSKASEIKFQLIKDNNINNATVNRIPVNNNLTVLSTTFNVEAGHKYAVRACAKKDGVESEWSSLSSSVETMPAKVTLDDPKPLDSKTVELSWSTSTTAENYTLSYVSGPKGFYEGDNHSDVSGITVTTYTLEIAPGEQYSFKVKAVKGQEESDWSDVKTVTLGTLPTSPTTWSSTTTAMSAEGESVALYWVHNSTDGSSQQSADVKLTIDGVDNVSSVAGGISEGVGELTETKIQPCYQVTYDSDTNTYKETTTLFTPNTDTHTQVADGAITDAGNTVYSVTASGETTYYYQAANVIIYTITAATSEIETNPTHSVIINTKEYSEGAKITWTVATTSTAGKTSDPSTARVVEIFNKPSVLMEISNGADEVGITYHKVEYLENTDTYHKLDDTLEDEPADGTPISESFTVEGDHQVRTGTINGETVLYCIVEANDLTSLPLNVKVEVEANEDVQVPVEYVLSVSADDTYNTVDNFGNPVTVSTGQTIFSKHYTAAGIDKLDADISAGDISLENGQFYTVKCLVAMSSGVMVEAFTQIHISWSSDNYYLSAEIAYDETDCSVALRPYCVNSRRQYYEVNKLGTVYYISQNELGYVYGSLLSPAAFTITGEKVYQGNLEDGTSVYYTIVDSSLSVTDVLFSVYRREYDGSFTPVYENLDGSLNSFVTDPHPSLDYARYRLVAKDNRTSKITYSDSVTKYIGEKAIIIQWDEPYSTFLVSEDELGVSSGTTSFLRLPYNIDVTNARAPDVSLIKYIGRKNPVSYYGTQRGEGASWSTVVPKSDTETIYALQRLQAYMGDVYVREPNGTGYWANVQVSFSKNHLETTVPVSIDITRVEGGA